MGVKFTNEGLKPASEPAADGSRVAVSTGITWASVLVPIGSAIVFTTLVHLGLHYIGEKAYAEAECRSINAPLVAGDTTFAQRLAIQNSAKFNNVVDQLYYDAIKGITAALQIRAPESMYYISPDYEDNLSEIKDALINKLRDNGFAARRSYSFNRAVVINLSDLYE